MSVIRLHRPVETSEELQRLNLFAGRHLGEEEFDRIQAYTDERLAPLLSGSRPGIVRGLEVDPPETGQDMQLAQGEFFTVRPGLAVSGNSQVLGLYYPVRQTWKALIDSYRIDAGVSSAEGVFYLVLRRSTGQIDATAGVDACARTDLDPRRDTRRVVLGTIGLRRLAVSAQAQASLSRSELENWIAADHAGAEFLGDMTDAAPLALLAIRRLETAEGEEAAYAIDWLTQAAGRYLAIPNSGYLVLLNQVRTAFRRALADAEAAETGQVDVAAHLSARNFRLGYLPAAGELPMGLLRDAAERRPSLGWLPGHLGIDMVPVPEEAVPALIERRLPRRLVDLVQPSGARIRLLLAVNEPDYRPDLLDFPQVDSRLLWDLYRYFRRAHEAWRAWMGQFQRLYFLGEAVNLTPVQLAALALPEPYGQAERPEHFLGGLVEREKQERGLEDETRLPSPYPEYVAQEDEAFRPPAFYTSWLVPSPGEQESAPPGPDTPTQDGLVIQYALAQQELEALDNQVRAIRTRLEKTRDYLLLQRQQLDMQTASLAGLAGGVIGDGSGLQVARWLPFTEFQVKGEEQPPEGVAPAPEAVAPAPAVASIAAFSLYRAAAEPRLAPIIRPLPAAVTVQRITGLSATPVSAARATMARPGARVAKTSALEYALASDRLDDLKAVPKRPVSKPAFDVSEERFGVLQHVRPEVNEYKNAFRGMAELMTTARDMFDKKDADSLVGSLKKFGKLQYPDDIDKEDEEAGEVLEAEAPPPELTSAKSTQRRYWQLFRAGQILVKQISVTEARYGKIEAQLLAKLRHRDRQEAQAAKLADEIAQAQDRLQTLDGRRIEQLGDYGVAQRLVDEDWQRVEQEFEKRKEILSRRLRGLYYVRVQPTPISAALPAPLALRSGRAGDIVPGCDWVEDPELPEQLSEFFEGVLEVPMADWELLAPMQDLLPSRPKLQHMAALRQARYANWNTSQASVTTGVNLGARLAGLLSQNRAVLYDFSRERLPALRSLKELYVAGARVFSLQDLLTIPSPVLRGEAQQLRLRLEQCLACMLDRLNAVPPSIRLQWAQLAEDDRLAVEQPQAWPGLERAQREDFSAVRTLVELTAWWFRQLRPGASRGGRVAMRNMVRASLISAALGDPAEILHGQVHIPPRRFQVGESMRLKLNREVAPGARLQLLDQSQRIVGLLRVDDHDDQGAVASIVQVQQKDLSVDTRFSVVASRAINRLRY